MNCSIQHKERNRSRRWPTVILLVAVILTTSAVASHAQQVTIKRSFFTGWKYSTDGKTFHKVGAGADDLMLVMEDHRVCVSALRSYRAHSAAAKMTGLTAVALIAFPLISDAIGGEWSNGSTPMIMAGLGFGALSLALEESGSRNLKQAVRIYNRYQGRYQAHHAPALRTAPPRPFFVSFKLRF
ncbi:MAG: hypothetical protein Kow0074_11710 [Candidatus Zixiibacteriota bacterium]